MTWLKLRSSEWILVGFFTYTAALTPFFRDRPRLSYQPIAVLATVLVLLGSLALAEKKWLALPISMLRDWMPMALTLAAFRELELFVPGAYGSQNESAWVRWDDIVLREWGLKHVIESLGPVIPLYLELCYLLVYGLGTFCLIVLWIRTQRRAINRFNSILLTGTLLVYALIPYFPSRPPRIAFPGIDFPSASNVFRQLNLFLLSHATIHTGVYPSAHVSAAFSAAWAMFLVLPQRKRIGWALLLYALSVSAATIYGRYHYATDALAGFAISLIAGSLCLVLRQRSRTLHKLH